MTDLLENFRLSARNNRYANAMIATACEELGAEGVWAKGVNFFPSIGATLNHLIAIDRYYID
ncbi:MAG: damage-inducible protein DinB, partial [Pseudomonadota bacterium]